MSDELRSALAEAIEAQDRERHEFDVRGFFGLGDKPVPKLAIRVATKAEEDAALVAAHATVRDLSGGDKNAMADFDLLGDQKLIQILFRVCFSATEKTTEGVYYPAFPGPDWMRRHMTTDQIATVMNLYHEVRKASGSTRSVISFEDVEGLALACAEASGSDLPEAMLANADRTWLTEAFILLAVRYKELCDVRDRNASKPAADAGDGEGSGAVHAPVAEGGGGEGAQDAHLQEQDGEPAD